MALFVQTQWVGHKKWPLCCCRSQLFTCLSPSSMTTFSAAPFCLVDFLWPVLLFWPFAFDSFLHCVDCGLCGSPSIALFSRHPPDFTSADVGDSNARPNVQGLARRRPHIFDTRKLESVGQSPVKREPFLASVPGSKSTTEREERTFWPARVTRPTTMRPSVARCENFFGSPNVSTQNGKWR